MNIGFASLASHYEKGRQGFPPWVFDIVGTHLHSLPAPCRVLDAGCGTGISTRQLAEAFPTMHVIGLDKEHGMLDAARRGTSCERVSYLESDVSLLSVRCGASTFSAVTAFSSFHWFGDNPLAMSGIVTVLRPGGCLFVANKDVQKEVIPSWPQLLERWIGHPPRRQKVGFSALEVIHAYGLDAIRSFKSEEETYTPSQALDLLQSSSLWNQIPSHRQDEARAELGKRIAAETKSGVLTRKVDIVTLLAVKKW